MRILFFGTPEIAVPFLKWLGDHHTVAGVVTQTDKPSGRGYFLSYPPVKKVAYERGYPVFQPEGPWTQDLTNALDALRAEIGLVVAYGRKIPKEVYQIPRFGTLNIHFSLLPKLRGPAPIQWAIANGEKETGITIFWLDEELDSGPIFYQESIRIEPQDTSATLREKLIPAGLKALDMVLRDISNGKIIKIPQTGQVTYAPLLKKEDGIIQWANPASQIVNLIRAFFEWPGAATYYKTGGEVKRLKIHVAELDSLHEKTASCGEIIHAGRERGIVVQAGEGWVRLLTVQPEGKTSMPAWAFWQGAHLKIGDRFE